VARARHQAQYRLRRLARVARLLAATLGAGGADRIEQRIVVGDAARRTHHGTAGPVGAACARVGYENSSQFSREFKHLFGRTPVDEVNRMRKSFALPPQDEGAQFVSSH